VVARLVEGGPSHPHLEENSEPCEGFQAFLTNAGGEEAATHVTSDGIFGIGLLRKEEANWGNVREILLAGWPRCRWARHWRR